MNRMEPLEKIDKKNHSIDQIIDVLNVFIEIYNDELSQSKEEKETELQKRCSKCLNPFESHHHRHITRKGQYHTSCYEKIGEKDGEPWEDKSKEPVEGRESFTIPGLYHSTPQPAEWEKLIYKGKYSGRREGKSVCGDLQAGFFLLEDVKSLLTQQREEIAGKVVELSKDIQAGNDDRILAEKVGYNQALDDILTIIKEK